MVSTTTYRYRYRYRTSCGLRHHDSDIHILTNVSIMDQISINTKSSNQISINTKTNTNEKRTNGEHFISILNAECDSIACVIEIRVASYLAYEIPERGMLLKQLINNYNSSNSNGMQLLDWLCLLRLSRSVNKRSLQLVME